ncbi:MAG: hypothetical protein ABIH29_03460 [Candidatus Micrarchaeota archaeon]
MKKDLPKKLLGSRYRRDMWEEARKVVGRIEGMLPVSSAYVLGSFTTKKKRPADVDFIILLKTKADGAAPDWSADIVIAPDNEYGRFILEDADKWMKEKYGLKKSALVRIK